MRINTGKDFWSGLMFLGFAAVGLLVSRGYSLGSAGRMGPGYFPMLLGISLGVLGLLLIARSVAKGDEPVPSLSLRGLAFLVGSVALFGVTIRPLGMIVALLLTLAVAAIANRKARLIESALLAVGLSALSVLIFYFALQLPIPMLPAFLSPAG